MKQNLPTEQTQIHYNNPQIKSLLIQAWFEIAIWGRGTGKSEGVIAPRAVANMVAMPRSMGVFVASTYQQLLTRTLPPVIKGIERLGYIEGRDWVFGRLNKKWDKPIFCPLKHDHMFHFRDGSAISLVSQDRPGSANGISIDWVAGDEAKFLKQEQFQSELIPAIRGNEGLFSHLSNHQSILLTTDMPITPGGNWLFDYEKLVDHDAIEMILNVQAEIARVMARIDPSKPLAAKNAMRLINRYKSHLNMLRKDLVYYSEASTLENIEMLGEAYIKRQRQVLTPLLFRTSILNERLTKVESGFYALLGEKHMYESYDYNYLDRFNLKSQISLDSRQDADVIKSEPLHIALDYNASIWPLVVGQVIKDELRIVKGLHVLHPGRLKEVIENFCDYFEFHSSKTVFYHYDATAIQKFNRDQSFADEVKQVLTNRGWTIINSYQGQPMGHHEKYAMINACLSEDSSVPLALRFNRQNTQDLLISMQQSKVRQGRNGFEKDKTDERKEEINQALTTHYSDAFDMLFIGVIEHTVPSYRYDNIMSA